MAGLEGISADRMDIIDALGARRFTYDAEARIARPVVRHADKIPVARHDGDGNRVIDRVRFGIPVAGGRLITNARDDRLATASSWQALFGDPAHHCLTAISYVVERDATTKSTYRIERIDGRLIVVPGLAAVRHYAFASTGNEYDDWGHVQVTAPADPFVATIHDRFVVDLADASARNTWMAADADECAALLRPADPDTYHMVPIAPDAWRRRDDPDAVTATGAPRRHADGLAPGRPEKRLF